MPLGIAQALGSVTHTPMQAGVRAGDARSRFEGDAGAEVNHEPCGPAASGA